MSAGGAAESTTAAPAPALEMWAGVECTINRVGNHFRDQLQYAGCYTRIDDAERIADLGVRAVRWPILWERHDQNESAWQYTDRILEIFRKRDVQVIAGLVHHGSGPHHTDLLDPGFAAGLAGFAQQVATRYPWIRHYTPVNEPLTTARFAALYGVWFPHMRDDTAFVTALLNQTIATQAAMRAIRATSPGAELVQTEDLAYVRATPPLDYQAAFENERRWLTYDLLFGRVTRSHPMFEFLARSASLRNALHRIAENAAEDGATPSLIGVNYYVTSERFLDHRVDAYDPRLRGGNGREQYVDIEAVRIAPDGLVGLATLLEQVWERYKAPIAVTEAHLACTREQQVCWLHDVWRASHEARSEGVDVRAVTAWATFGSFDWRSLLTRDEFAYESGVFDVRAPQPRDTALVQLVRTLARNEHYQHPVLDAERWWLGPDRLVYPDPLSRAPCSTVARNLRNQVCTSRALLVTGAAGTLGRAFMKLARERGLACTGVTRQQLDITSRAIVAETLDNLRPWAVVNTAGWVRVDDAELDADACMRANTIGAHILAEECAARGIAFVSFSSDLVFSGNKSQPYVESDSTSPLNVYGRSKAESEQRVLAAMPSALVVRTSAFFGDWDDWNFVSRTLAHLHCGSSVLAPGDAVVSPTYVADLVHASLDLLIDGEQGVWHLANVGALTWVELARLAATRAGLDAARIERCNRTEIGWTAPRPAWSVLGSERAKLLPDVDDAMARYVRSRAWERVAQVLTQSGDFATAGLGKAEQLTTT